MNMGFSTKYMRSIIIFITFVATTGQKCMSSLVTNGYTIPQGDITLRYGEALNITCNLCKEAVDKYGVNASSRLYFTRDNESIPPEMIKIINSTSINLYIAEHPKTVEDNYYCYFNATEGSQMICMNVVYVGVAPQNVTDFSCISRNYDNLTCTWTSPENYVRTDYNLTYNVKSRSARFSFNCPRIMTENRKNTCFWNLKTSPQYRPAHECYYFAIGMSNDFGVNMNYITFDHFKHVLPNPPENLTAVATSPHSVKLSWTIPNSMITFIPGLDHRILYQSEYEKEWHLGGFIRKVKNKTLTYELKNLKYAHILYDIRVSMRSSVADESDESMWSENATRTVRTQSKPPDCPPKINFGSFQIVSNGYSRNVYIYWQQLKEEQYNGQNLTYVVEVISHPSISTVKSIKAYAMLENLYLNEEYTVNIWSVNEMGRSSEKSTLIIPAKTLDKPSYFIKEHNGDLYEVSWQAPHDPESAAAVTNYTIFWCRNERDRPYQCAGILNWEVVSKNTRRYTRSLPLSDIYQFAISANSWNSSSGMCWAECTIIPNKSKGKIENVWIKHVDSTFIEVGWSLDCSNRVNTIQGFAIHYCPVETPTQISCKNGTEKNVTIKGDVNLQFGTVTGLTPRTSYRLTVSYILNNFTYSLPSQPLRNTTREAAPTPPLHLEVVNISNSSISLKWQPPSKMNGYLKNYYVYYNEKVENSTTNEIILKNLMSYTNYTISVQACTINCSNRSGAQTVTTKMWIPGKIKPPTISFQNDSYITVKWERPNPARGEINYYQVKIKERPDMDDTPSINITTTNYTLEGCASGKYKHLYISVRAVNIIDGEHKVGPWSYDLESSCTPYTSVLYIVVCSLVIFLGIGMVYGLKRIIQWIKADKNFIPKLPPGLEDILEVQTWNSEKQTEDIEPRPPADAQRLLQKISETPISGDSSGCSSGHESITSLESAAHISPSDSGTEQPRSPSLNEENRKNSLRLRNVSAAAVPRPTINMGYVTADTLPSANLVPKPSTPAGNYCVLGVDPSNTTRADPPYVPIADLSSKLPFSCDQPPPPYVMTGNLVKTPSPGYVPYSTTEPTDKNMGYVVAGLTKDLLASDLLQCDTPIPAINEEKPLYVTASESIPTLKPQFPWHQPSPQLALPKSGYVSVGDAPPPKSLTETTKGYVPHRQFEGKSLKED